MVGGVGTVIQHCNAPIWQRSDEWEMNGASKKSAKLTGNFVAFIWR